LQLGLRVGGHLALADFGPDEPQWTLAYGWRRRWQHYKYRRGYYYYYYIHPCLFRRIRSTSASYKTSRNKKKTPPKCIHKTRQNYANSLRLTSHLSNKGNVTLKDSSPKFLPMCFSLLLCNTQKPMHVCCWNLMVRDCTSAVSAQLQFLQRRLQWRCQFQVLLWRGQGPSTVLMSTWLPPRRYGDLPT